jgi:hypothetical protein
MRWTEYTATLSEQEQQQLTGALSAMLTAARQATVVALEDGEVAEARVQVEVVAAQVLDLLRLLPPA